MSDRIVAGARIVVGIDGSDNARTALRWAVDAARQRHASVDAIYVWHVPALAYSAPGYIPMSPTFMEEQTQLALDRAMEGIDPGDVKLRAIAIEGLPVDALTRAADEPDVDLLVVGARGHGGILGLMLGSVSHALSHHTTKPLAIVPAVWDQSAPGLERRPILVGLDRSPASTAALEWAVSEARGRDIGIEAFLVWTAPTPMLPAYMPTPAPDAITEPQWFESKLAEQVESIDHSGVEIACVVEDGEPAATLIERAAGNQMLVLGTRRIGRAHELLTGSVSHACSNHSPVPVVIVPEHR